LPPRSLGLLEDSTTMLLTATNQTKRYRALWRVLACLFTVVGFIGVSTGTASALSFSSTVSSSGQSTVVGLETRVGVTTSFSAGSSARLATVRAGCVGENHPGYDSFVSASCVATNTGASNAANGVRLNEQLTAEEIAGGHAFDKHVIDQGEFPGVTTRSQFAQKIESVIRNGEAKSLSGGRIAWWDSGSGTVVIRNPGAVDGGTAFVPTNGRAYFDGLK
jgi:hypothetical protein